MSNLCSRGVYGCRHDEGHIPTRDSVLQYFKDHDGYILSRYMHDHFGCCTEERSDKLSAVLSDLLSAGEIKLVSSSAWGLVGSDHPKIQTQKQFQFKEDPTKKVHFITEGRVMIHDRDQKLLFDYVGTENPDEVTCGTCLRLLRIWEKKGKAVPN